MANNDEIMTVCECQYTPGRRAPETKDNFNNAPSIHEIDEEESETEETAILEQLNRSAPDGEEKVALETKNTSDDESAYTGESFCSEDSCNESEITNVTSESLNSSSVLRLSDLQRNRSSKEHNGDSRWKDNLKDDESYTSNDKPSRAATADRFAKPRRCRWNMSFTDEEMRKIERENELLLRKIMAQQKPRHKILPERTIQPRANSSAINRKKLQKKIENDNMLLLRRIQQTKSCVFADASKMGCRLTFL